MNKSLQDEIKASYIARNAHNLAKDTLENLRMVSLLSLAINAVFTVVIIRLLEDSWVINLGLIVLYLLFSFFAYWTNRLLKRNDYSFPYVYKMTLGFLFIMSFSLIFMSVYINNEILPLFFILFLVLYPTLFLLKEIDMVLFILVSGLVFIIGSYFYSGQSNGDLTMRFYFIITGQTIGIPINWMVLRLRKKELYLKELFIAYSHLDELTKLPNRRAFNLHIEKVYKHNSINHIPLGIAIIDIDDFKLYNDYYGHLEGDNILEALGNIIQNQVKPDTFFARFGGEEFIGVFTNQPINTIFETLYKIKQDIKKLDISCSNTGQKLSISIGIAYETNLSSTNYMKLIDNADVALYKAKIYGKDKIEHYTAE